MTGVIEGHVVDVQVDCHGTVYLLHGISPVGQEWLEEHLDPEGLRYAGGFVVEHRYVQDIVNGALEDGLRIGGS